MNVPNRDRDRVLSRHRKHRCQDYDDIRSLATGKAACALPCSANVTLLGQCDAEGASAGDSAVASTAAVVQDNSALELEAAVQVHDCSALAMIPVKRSHSVKSDAGAFR